MNILTHHCLKAAVFAASLALTRCALATDPAARPATAAELKLSLLGEMTAANLFPNAVDPAQLVAEEARAADFADDPARPCAARIVDGSMTFAGADGFALVVEIRNPPSQSYLGYVVNDPDDLYQDMVVLDDLSSLAEGTHTILAACTDLHKPFPPDGHRMASRPQTSSSQNNWMYWVRKTALAGVEEGYSFDQIQLATWYITDREGEHNSLLRSIGYDSSDAAKNVDDNGGGGDDGGGTPRASGCGALGLIAPLLTLGGLCSFRRVRVHRPTAPGA